MIIGIDGNEANVQNRVGIGQFAFNVINQLSRIDKTNQYTVYLKEAPLPDMPETSERWKYRIFGPTKAWTQFALPLTLYLEKDKPSAFYSPSHYAPRFSPVNTVISIMDLWHHRHPEQFAQKDLYQLTKWESYSIRNAKHIITISEFSKSEIIKFYKISADRITVAYPGYSKIKNPAFAKATAGKQSSKFKIEETMNKFRIKNKYLIYLGTLQPKKNIERLIGGFSLIAKDNPELSLVIAGKKGWLFETIFNKTIELGLEKRVIFTGFVSEEEKQNLLTGSEAFVFPSLYEGFGIPVLEAMDLDVPVVCSKEGSLPEVGGEAAIYCNAYEESSIAGAIGKVLSLKKSEKDEIIRKGKNQCKKFSWEKCGQEVLSVLETYAKR